MGTIYAMVMLGWRQISRDRLALAGMFLLPVVVGALLVSIYESEDPDVRPIELGVLAGDDPVAESIVGQLQDNRIVDVWAFEDQASLERALRLRDMEAGLVIPPGVGGQSDVSAIDGDTSDSSDSGTVQLLGPPTIAAPGGVRAAVEAAVAETAAALYTGRAVDPTGSTAAQLATGAEELGAAPRANDADSDASRFRLQGAASSAIVATMVLFVFTNTMVGGGAMVSELRESGILARARTSRATSATLAGGIATMMATYALFQGTLVLATGTVLFDVEWRSLGATSMTLVATAFVAGGLGLLFGSVLPSSELSVTVGGPFGFFLAMVGGAVWPLEIVGPTLQTIGHSMPHAWAVDALQDAAIEGAGLADVVVPLAVLAVAALALVALGSWRVYRLAERA
jgi:ABC-2 type transport system permease protein